ncbi:MAG: phenylalanine--tRNA ligase subunit beta [Patescibacteria group bacterium]
MKIPRSWLREYVETTLPSTALAERLMMHGLEVEKIIDRRGDYDRIVVGAIVGIKPHPKADKLQLASVVIAPSGEAGSGSAGNGKPQTVVCGAPNIKVGQKVPVALLGAKLPNGVTIESRSIRGIVSEGMLCAEDELGLRNNHQGILILDPALRAGMPLATALGFDEVVIDIATPANRPDLMSVRGLAWEIAAILGLKFHEPKRPHFIATPTMKKPWVVKVTNSKLCPLYTARVIRNVTVKPSPSWLQQRLTAVGIRPINAIVDATNLILLEYGQPLHAFDAAKVRGDIVVRTARADERIVTLDRVARRLNAQQIVIADDSGPIALAGVMGGAATEISARTTDVLLESAIFDPVSIRRTSRSLGLVSEASKRFEKGLPPPLPERASRAAAALIVDLCGGQVVPGVTAIGTSSTKPVVVAVSPSYFSELLGRPLIPAKAKQILQRLGFKVSGTAKRWSVTVPSWRLDVTLPEDLVDEVGRLIGYEQLPESMPLINTIPQGIPKVVQLKEQIRDALSGWGLTEVITHSYYGEPWAREAPGRHLKVANPIDKSQHYLRRTLYPQTQSILRGEVKQGKEARIFQIGRVFTPEVSAKVEKIQPWKLIVAATVKVKAGYIAPRRIDGIVENLYQQLSVAPGKPRFISSFDARSFPGWIVEWCELDVADLGRNRRSQVFHEVPKVPPSYRDLSFWAPTDKKYAELERVIRNNGGRSLVTVELFDAFEKDRRRSYAIHLKFQAPDRTLTKGEVDEVMKKIERGLRDMRADIR